jgi:hypothetical protein
MPASQNVVDIRTYTARLAGKEEAADIIDEGEKKRE